MRIGGKAPGGVQRDNLIGRRIASPGMFPRHQSAASSSALPLPHLSPADPQLSFPDSKSMLTEVGPVELWATLSVVQAQRQIHRALRAAFTIAKMSVRTIAERPAFAVPRRIARIDRHGFRIPFGAQLLGANPSADAAVSVTDPPCRRRGTEPATDPIARAMCSPLRMLPSCPAR
jgi:hypothetical protein